MRVFWNQASLLVLILGFTGIPSAASAQPPPVKFREHRIEASIPGGYRVLLADLNRDGKPDVIGLSNRLSELYWYENPSWERHVVVSGMHRMITVAAEDLDGDGIPELAVATHFGQTETQSEGRVIHLRHQGDPRRPWKAMEFDRLPTSHRLRFADVDGDGRKELVNSPLTGPGARQPMFECRTPLVFYRPGEWKRRTITEDLDGVVHGMRTVRWGDADRDAVLTASFGGVWLHRSTGSGEGLRWSHTRLTPGDPAPRPNSGASEIRAGRLQHNRFLATIEPWHGHRFVVYTSAGDEKWDRRVIDESLEDGHAVELADFDGDGNDEAVVGFRGKQATLYLYAARDASGLNWSRHTVDDGDMAAAGCDIADLNEDGRPDLVCIGARTANIKWYENLGAAP